MPRKCVAVSVYKHILNMMHYYKTYRAKNKKLLLAALMLCFGTVATAQVQVGGSVFGGGNLAKVGGNSSVKVSQNGATITNDVYGGGALANVDGTATVQIDSGTVSRNVYGGGLGDADHAATVGDVVTVNIGSLKTQDNGFATAVDGDATIGGSVFGGNNANGTPLDNVFVNIYQTKRETAQEASGTGFALSQVFGGGNQASYQPAAGKKATVHIWTCDNTVEYVYGGGNAADVGKVNGANDTTKAHTEVVIDGGRMAWVFGGGNGASTPTFTNPGANIFGNVTVNFHAGVIEHIFGGSNEKGEITGSKTMNINNDGPCLENTHITELYGGSNKATVTGNVTLTMLCPASGEPAYKKIDYVFGGSREADIINGSVILNIQGGEYDYVFGGNNIDGEVQGDVTLNLFGGTINYAAFGGNKGGGSIDGNITVNVTDANNSCPLKVKDVFGAGDQAIYTAPTGEGAREHNPIVNINNIRSGQTITGNVYGGGNGNPADASQEPGMVTGHPMVVIGDVSEGHSSYLATIAGNVYGGGNAAKVAGTTTVLMQQANSTVGENVYGGGNLADVTGATDVDINGGAVSGDVYGGGALADVGGASVSLTGGTITGDLYGGGLGRLTPTAIAAAVNGNVTVSVSGNGMVKNVFGCNNLNGAPTGTVTVGVTGGIVNENVYGGGNEAPAGVSPTVTINGGTVTGNVFGGGNKAGVGVSDGTTLVTIQSGTVSTGVYGGCNTSGTVTGNIAVNVIGGAIGTSDVTTNNVLFGGGYGSSTSTTGNVAVTINGNTDIWGGVYGGSALGDVNDAESDATTVTLTTGTIHGSLYGGGLGDGSNAAVVNGAVTVAVGGGTVSDVFGCNNVNGAPQSSVAVNISGGTVTRVFGGGNEAAYTAGTPVVTVNEGSTIQQSIYGGGNKAGVKGTHVVINGGNIGNIAANTITTTNYGGVYGGCNESGVVDGDIVVDVLGGTFGTQAAINAEKFFNIFGGGYGDQTSTTGNVTVNYGSDNGTPKLYGDLYGGSALGSVNANASNTTTVNLLNGSFGQYSRKDNSIEYRYGGSIYGGGLGEEGTTSEAKAKGQVNGTVQVNVGAYTDKKTPSTYTGNVNLEHCSVYGCNNTNGSPQGDVYVDVYSTYHETGKNDYASEDFAIENVYGGGNKANYQPVTPDGGHSVSNGAKTHVFVHGCANTVKYVYGGGNAADAVGAMVEIEGGHFGDVFGGGNGLVTPANVGLGGAGLAILSGRVTYQYEGCNMQGNITGAKYNILKNTTPTTGYKSVTDLGALGKLYNYGDTVLNAIRPEGYFYDCNMPLTVETWFFGGNEAEIYTGLDNTITCEKAGEYHYKNVYAGSRHASIYGDVKLTVEGGEITNLFGGSRGYEIKPAHIKKHPTDAQLQADKAKYDADPTNYKLEYSQAYRAWRDTVSVKPTPGSGGNIVLTVRGGTIKNIFGGIDLSGNVEGSIIINIESNNSGTCPLSIDNIYGGSNLAEYRPLDSSITSPVINIKNGVVGIDSLYVAGEVHGCVFGGGKGSNDYMDNGVVTSNPKVLVQPGIGQSVWVKGNIYGGGYLASVGKFTRNDEDFPTACAPSTGKATVEILGGKVGPAILKMPDFRGHVFGGGKGIVNENPHTPTINFVNTTEVIIGGNAFVKGSVYGGAENGHVLDSTYVRIEGGQIGCGWDASKTTDGERDLDAPYDGDDFFNPSETAVTEGNVLHECNSWPYTTPYAPYDKFAKSNGRYGEDESSQSARGGMPYIVDENTGNVTSTPSDGHTFYGNVFGGGSGYFPYAPGKWLWSAGAVYGNTRVKITGGHILTSVYGGNELTSVEGPRDDQGKMIRNAEGKLTRGISKVTMSGGTLGVPRTDAIAQAHPVTCYLFGGGKGDQRQFFNKQTNVDSTYVEVSGTAIIYGSIFGGAEDGHVNGNAKVKVSGGVIGSTGSSYVDGNVFGGGRGFSGEALTEGVVCGNTDVEISSGKILGSIYGGGRLASVGTYLVNPDDQNYTSQYGNMQPDNGSESHGHIKIGISGDAVIGHNKTSEQYGGYVFAGCMGRLYKLDGTTLNTNWDRLAKAKTTEVTISGSATVKRNVYGGGEFGFVNENTQVNIAGGTVNGIVYGGGYGSDVEVAKVLAGRVYGKTEVNITAGTVKGDVYGGGEMASVGTANTPNTGNTTVNIGKNNNDTYEGTAIIGGNIFGANNKAGTPMGYTNVNIYSTKHSDSDKVQPTASNFATPQAFYNYVSTAAAHATTAFALQNVYGAGNEADYTPMGGVSANVHIYGCQNTVRMVYGGGRAANAGVKGGENTSAVPTTCNVTIDGGRIDTLFAGGDGHLKYTSGEHTGEYRAADIIGDVNAAVNGGFYSAVFGASNTAGEITGASNLSVNAAGNCGTGSGSDGKEYIGVLFGGGNLADAQSDVTLTVGCGAGHIQEVYGGCNLANITGNVTLNLYGGTYTNVFGGSRGALAGDDARFTNGKAANITGNVTLNLYGGTIDGEAFGGSNRNGNITGTIKVNMIDHKATDCGLVVHNIYGASNLADYTPTGTNVVSPQVNLIHGKVTKKKDANNQPIDGTGHVFGGAKGGTENNTIYPATVAASPRVRMGYASEMDQEGITLVNTSNKSQVEVEGNVYGGGSLSPVTQNTSVTMQRTEETDSYTSVADGNIFGGGKEAAVTGTATVAINGGAVGVDVYGGGELATTGGTSVTFTKGTVTGTGAGNIYGGGKGESTTQGGSANIEADVTGPVTVYIEGGTVNNVFGCNYINGAPTGNVTVNVTGGTVNENIYGGGNLANAKHAETTDNYITVSTVNVSGGSALKVFGGGKSASAGRCTVNVSGAAAIAKGVYGGCDNSGYVYYDAEVNLTGGMVGADGTLANRADGVFGGGYGSATSVIGNVTVTFGDNPDTRKDTPILYGDLYGGSAFGSVNTTQTTNTVVNAYNGTIVGNVYGGGKGDAGTGHGNWGNVYGVVTVNIGTGTLTNPTDISSKVVADGLSGNVYIRMYDGGTKGGCIFGGNNIGGSPQDNVYVKIWKTYRASNEETGGALYAIDQVFGGGNEADFPNNGKTVFTRIHGCDNTVRRVFGGGNAADVPNVLLYVDGGRFDYGWGGGNGERGENYAADVYGSVTGYYSGTWLHELTAGSNANGNVPSSHLTEDPSKCGAANVEDLYCGSTSTIYVGSKTTTIACGSGTYKNIYGGSKFNDYYGNIKIILNGSKAENVYGGCNSASVKAFDASHTPSTDSIGKGGNVEIVLRGGTFDNIYGGCNISGSVEGKITITVDSTTQAHDSCRLVIHNIYGGGREAAYTPSTAIVGTTLATPEVNVLRGSVTKKAVVVQGVTTYTGGNVYGGGYGTTATVQANPVVNIGGQAGYRAIVRGSVYGGGEDAPVNGSTSVNVLQNKASNSYTLTGTVFGGGNNADVTGNVNVVIGDNNAGPTINGDIYGGGAFAHTGTSGHTDAATYYNNVSLYNGTVNGNIYGGGLGDGSHAAAVYSPVNVKVYGGTADTVFGCNNVNGAPQSTVKVDVYGTDQPTEGKALKAVFGGGNQAAYTYVGATVVSPAVAVHNCTPKIGVVYGGGNAAAVPATDVTIYGGDITTVYGGGNGVKPDGTLVGNEFTMVGGTNATGNTNVKIYGGNINNVFGGNNVSGNILGSIEVSFDAQGEGTSTACTMAVGNVYGGGNLAHYNPTDKTITSPLVTLTKGTVTGNVFGGGKGSDQDIFAGRTVSNPKVEMNGAEMRVHGNIYGGGEMATVGAFQRDENNHYAVTGAPTNGTGKTTVVISNGTVGPTVLMMPDFHGHVFGGGKGITGDVSINALIPNLNYVKETDVTISGSAFVKGSVYGGSENGHVYGDTYVKIHGGQIGCGWDATKSANEKDLDAPYTDWAVESLYECNSWPFTSPYLPYDPYAADNDPDARPATSASDGHTFYGNVFGGGSGYFPYAAGQWLRSAGAVYGNTRVEITGGHILTSIYGGNEMTDVGKYNYTTNGATLTGDGTCTVTMSGGTLGVPRTEAQIAAHPVTCYLFGAGKGDPRKEFNTWTNVGSATVTVSGGWIYGSVFGGGEDGHVIGNAEVNISGNIPGSSYSADAASEATKIGTRGISYVDGNIFGGGRGFKGDVLTTGVVAGNVTVNITGGAMLGSVYGGGRLASVGTHLVPTTHDDYGKIIDDDANATHGYITVNISGGVIGNDQSYDVSLDHSRGGNVFGGCMGRLTLLDGSYILPRWHDLGKAYQTNVNISGNAKIKGNVYGGSELGTVEQNATVKIFGSAVIGNIDENTSVYRHGNVYGGGYGNEILTQTQLDDQAKRDSVPLYAGLTYDTTSVEIDGLATVGGSVFGGGDMASVGTPVITSGEFTGFSQNTGTTIVTVKGGTVGPVNDAHQNGHVYGGGRGKSSDDYKKYSNVASTSVTISGGQVKGDVYGGGADAHVLGNTVVNINTGANIGTNGTDNHNGNVFGGGRGSGAGTDNNFVLNRTCGRVGGNTKVTMDGGAILGSIFGGGRMALVGIDVDGGLGKYMDPEDNVYLSSAHGKTIIEVKGNASIGTTNSWELLRSDYNVGDIFGSGKGDVDYYNSVEAGRVMNTQITISGSPAIRGSVFGGGEMAGIGWWDVTGDKKGEFYANTGESTISISGTPTIGTADEFNHYVKPEHNDLNARTGNENPGERTIYNDEGKLIHTCTGNVIGGSQGDADTEPYEGTSVYKTHWASMGRSKSSTITISGGIIMGEVFGGAEQGTLAGNTTVTISGGTIGTVINAGETNEYNFGSVYGGAYGSNDVSEPHNDSSMRAVQIAGRVYGNTSVAVTNGTVKANVYGGGSYASVGNLTFGTTDNMPTACNGGGTAVVSISGGTIEGSVFGSSRGDVVELDQKLDDQAWTDSTSVTINTGAQVKGNVFGGGENGHVRGNTFVNIKGGTIGIAAADYNTNVSATEFGQCGNVYGAGSGMDKIDGKYNPKGGIVMGNTKVTVEGGYISRNVYGAGAMASVGTASIDKEHRDSTKTFAFSWPYKYTHVDGTGDAVVTITGGHIGTAANPTLSGDVYGSARGEAGDRYVFNRLANVRTATVTVNYDSPSDNITGDNVIVGSVYGSGENGHVYDSTIVTLENGLVGGSVFGGGKGTDTYLTRLKNPENEQWYDTYERSITAGKVYGNTYVTINGGTVKHSVYGGGNLASVGKGNYDGYGEKHANTDDSLLVENSGHCYVNVYGGTIGVDDENNNGHVFGSSKGIPFKTINKNPRINYSRDFFLAYSNKTTVTIGENTTTTGPHVYGSVFGGGENGHVRLDTWVRINSGEVGIDLDTNITKTSTDLNALTNSSKWIYRGNVFGAGRGMDTTADGQYCSSAGSVTRNTLVDINGGKIYRNVHGGGSLASVGPPPTYTTEISTCTVNINAAVGASTAPISGKNAYAHYGGYVGGASRGLPGLQFAGFATCKNSVVNINEGANVRNTVYGGGENGQVLGNTQVNINGGYVRASVYGGGKGSWQDTTLDVNCRHCYDNDTISGRVKGNTEVNLLGGSVQWVYGGCSRALVDGDATVNVGDSNLSCAGVTFHGSTHGGVYGSNQYVGSPKGDIHVNIYKTAHTATDSAIFVGTAPTTPTYAIGKVIGGGYQANYEPKDGKQIYLNIYTCDNTIQDVYGGGDAASVTNTTTIIRGGRFDHVFGGGNGTSSPAHVTGTSNLTITAGQIHQLFGGSNSQGSVKNSIVTISHDSTSCPEDIDEYFGGGNEADITGDIATTIECGAKFRSVYGGSNKADITGNVTLNINGGTIENVYGGSKGETDPGESARQGLRDTAAANITGNVTLNIYGGTIKRAFGGSNINGNITGKVMVNVDWSQSNCAGKQLDTVFGASNLAAYSPSSSLNSPEVNLIHATVKDVFGAGKGESAKASINANPKVTVGGDLSNTDKQAIVTGSVFGGGDLADVGGVTTVTVQKKNSEVKYVYGGGNADTVGGTQVFVTGGKVDYLFGGGKGDNNSGAKAKVDGNDTIAITGGRILKAFGGSNLNGDITGRVHLRVEKSTDSLFIGEVYGGGNYAAGHAGTITIGCTGNWSTAHNSHNDSTNRIGYELEGISVVYGGANRAAVTSDSIKLTISSGIVDSVFGGNNQSGDISGKIQVNIDKTGDCDWYVGHVFGGGNHARYNDTTEVNIKVGTVTYNVFGGGNDITTDDNTNTDVGAARSKVNMSGGIVKGDLYGGCNTKGTVAIDTKVTLTNGTVEGSVYGGGLGPQTVVTGKATIDISGTNTRVDNDVYGGGNEGQVKGGTDVKIH